MIKQKRPLPSTEGALKFLLQPKHLNHSFFPWFVKRGVVICRGNFTPTRSLSLTLGTATIKHFVVVFCELRKVRWIWNRPSINWEFYKYSESFIIYKIYKTKFYFFVFLWIMSSGAYLRRILSECNKFFLSCFQNWLTKFIPCMQFRDWKKCHSECIKIFFNNLLDKG